MVTEKTKIGKILSGKLVQNVLAPLVRGAVKVGIPIFGTPIVEVISNWTGAKKVQPLLEGGVISPEVEIKPKHSYVSIIVQLTIGVGLVVAVYTKAITVQELIDIAKQFLPTP